MIEYIIYIIPQEGEMRVDEIRNRLVNLIYKIDDEELYCLWLLAVNLVKKYQEN